MTRNVGNVVMDLNGVEAVALEALGGADDLVVDDLAGTDVDDVAADLDGVGGGDDAQPDDVIANASAGDDVVSVTGAGTGAQVTGLVALVSASGAGAGDRLTVGPWPGTT